MTTAATVTPYPWLEGVAKGVCGRFGVAYDSAWTQRVGSFYKPPSWVAEGSVSGGDAMFLYSLVRAIKPRKIVEIGVASGCSTAVLAAAAHDSGRPMPDERHEPVVHGFDVLDHVYFDKARAVGSAVHDMVPQLTGGIRIHPGLGASDAAAMFRDEPLAFAFIDANHNHPWPVADLLALSPGLAPGAWIALHDLALPRIAKDYEKRTGERVTWGTFGPQWLFEHWPFEKLMGEGEGWNIGAVRMPDRPLALADVAHIVDLPWESQGDDAVRELLGRSARA